MNNIAKEIHQKIYKISLEMESILVRFYGTQTIKVTYKIRI